jgi:ELWxxDGT repeat protein
MQKIMITAVLAVTMFAASAQQFNKVEVNPLQGTEQFLWSDSSKRVYGAGELSASVEMNGLLYFVAQDSYYNDELWVTDGTQQGTHLVKEINPYGGAGISGLHKVGNHLVFSATTDSGDVWATKTYDLYVSDGTAQGTFMLADLNEWSGDFLTGSRVISFNNKFVFCSSSHVMVTDGTISGTNQLSPITQYAQGFGYCEMNGKVYFAINQNNSIEIWSTDGSAPGTMMAMNLTSSNAAIQYASEMKAYNGKLYIVGAPVGQGNDLYTYDGNPNGTVSKVTLASGGNSYPSQLSLYNNRLWFIASNMSHTNLYVVNTDNQVFPVPTAETIDVYGELAFGNNRVYFTDGMDNRYIHSVQAEPYFNYQLIDLKEYRLPFYWQTGKGFLVAKGGNVYLAAYDSLNQQQFFLKVKGDDVQVFMPATSNTVHPFNAIISCGMADAFDFTVFNNKIVVPANFDNSGRELWFFEDADLTGIRETEKVSQLTVFPNPATDAVNISTGLGNYCQTEIVITELSGKAVLALTGNSELVTVNTSKLSAGEYIGAVLQNGVLKGTARFIVNK